MQKLIEQYLLQALVVCHWPGKGGLFEKSGAIFGGSL